MRSIRVPLILLLVIVAAGFSIQKSTTSQPEFNQREYQAHLEFLAHDLLEGRAMGTRGGELAAHYIASQFQIAGLEPISAEEGYFQRIEFRGHISNHTGMEARIGDETLTPVEDIVAISETTSESVSLSDELLFVGYGIEAPEMGWNDYKDVDVSGRTLVMLVNDPDLEKTGFGDENLSYYGRWTYKQQIARLKAARALILLHSDPTATYGFQVVQSGWTAEEFYLDGKPNNPLEVFSWISKPAIDRALAGQELSFDALKEMADDSDFSPMDLDLDIEISFDQSIRTLSSPNVIGVLPGDSNPDEYIVITAHYDHMGVGIANADGDRIYNGALDNASGTAGIISLAKAFAEASDRPDRTLVFFANTGEESGLLGSTYYAENPPFALEDTVLVVNKDVMNFFGTRDAFSAFPAQYSSAMDKLDEIAERHNLEHITLDSDTRGFAFRSDHFPFAARGIPAMSVSMQGAYLSIGEERAEEIRAAMGNTYHQPSDEVHPAWQYDGIIQELELLYVIIEHWANSADRPHMVEGNPFDATMRLFEQLDN